MEILKIGIPTLTFQLLTSLSIALINRASSTYGDVVIAGMGAVTRVTSMGTLVVFGFLKGFQPIAGFSYGAKISKDYGNLLRYQYYGQLFLRSCWFVNGCVLYSNHLTIRKWKWRNDFGRTEISCCKRFIVLLVRILYSLFFFVSCTWERYGRIFSRGLPPGDLLCSNHFAPSCNLGHEWNIICSTDC